jgi:hypothetical protein
MSTSDGGKGSDRRPGEGYADGWDRIFGGKKKVADEAACECCACCAPAVRSLCDRSAGAGQESAPQKGAFPALLDTFDGQKKCACSCSV